MCEWIALGVVLVCRSWLDLVFMVTPKGEHGSRHRPGDVSQQRKIIKRPLFTNKQTKLLTKQTKGFIIRITKTNTITEVTTMSGIKIGIGRVSTKEQNDARQREAFLAEGIEERYIFIDKCGGNGGNLDKRDEYQKAKAIARKGDEIYLDALDRLGRNTKEIEQEWRYFTEEAGCYVVVMNMPLLDTRPKESDAAVDVSEMVAKIALAVFSWMAQKETEERKRRQAGGIAVAKADGKYKGRKPVEVDKYEFARLYAEVERGERTNKYVMDTMNLKRNTYYKLVDEYKTKTGRFEE